MSLTIDPTEVRSVHQTPLGPMIAAWTDAGLYSLGWEHTPDHQSVKSEHSSGWRAGMLDDRLREFFATGRSDFDSIPIDTTGWTDFAEQVYRCCRSIRSGTTLSYKELATRAGNPAASRAVGAAMARNRILLVVPCHRVVSAGGGLRGFSAPGGLQTKQFLLDLETR
jgi:methylated-DNA-[protein]-cysteine S-methyltransferase